MFRSWWARLVTVVGGGFLLTGLLYVVAQAIGGSIGNFAYDLLKAAPEYLSGYATSARWVPFSILILMLIVCGTLWELYQGEKNLKNDLFRAANLARLEERLLTLLAIAMTRNTNRGQALKSVMESFLQDVVDIFGNGSCRALIFRPNRHTGYLEVWEHYGGDQGKLPNRRFYIGSHANKPCGVAGYAFSTHKLELVLISKEHGRWIGNHIEYVPSRTETAEPSYKSFAVVPFLNPEDECIGILCVDSVRRETFEDKGNKELRRMLDGMGISIAAAIVMYDRLIELEK